MSNKIPKGKYFNAIKVLEIEKRDMSKMYQLYIAQEEGAYWHGRLQEIVSAIKCLKSSENKRVRGKNEPIKDSL